MNKHFDIVVAGGGFAGVGAAVAAAREGKSVLLIEKYNCLGGAACFDLVNPFMPYATKVNGEKKVLSRGIFEEILNLLKAEGGMWEGSSRFNEETLKILLNRLVIKSGVTLLFNALITDAAVSNGRVTSLTVSHIGGRETVEADYVIDCTGDANVAFLGGFPFRLGRETDHLCQPMTLCFRVGNVDAARFNTAEINALYTKQLAEGKFRNPRENVLMFRTAIDSVIHFNTTRVVKLNPTDGWDVTAAEIEAREQIDEMVTFLRTNFEAFRHCQLISSGIQIGARESRMIEGLHTLTCAEIMACTKFEDGIAACNYDIDIHSPDGTGTSHYYFPDGQYYTVPYRSLVPQGASNLLVAGRCVGCDHEAQASLRIMPVCCTLGEAAGTAAAMACTAGITVDKVDTAALRDTLRSRGCVVD